MSTFRTSSFCKTNGCRQKVLHIHRWVNASTDCVAGIWGVMGCTVVQTETSGETNSCLEPILLYQSTHAVFDAIRDLCHRHPRAYELACMFSNKTMNLGTTPDNFVCEIWVLHGRFLQIALLLRGCTPRITNAGLSFRSR